MPSLVPTQAQTLHLNRQVGLERGERSAAGVSDVLAGKGLSASGADIPDRKLTRLDVRLEELQLFLLATHLRDALVGYLMDSAVAFFHVPIIFIENIHEY